VSPEFLRVFKLLFVSIMADEQYSGGLLSRETLRLASELAHRLKLEKF
jgi:hypothetical protein